MYDYAFHLGMHIKCTNGSPIVDTLDHLPPLPLFIDYRHNLTKRDELGIYHALQLRDRVHHIDLSLPPSMLHNVFVFLGERFPTLEHLSLTFPLFPIFPIALTNSVSLTPPKAFLAPNLRHLALSGISPPRRLRLLTFTVSLVKLELMDIQTSSYFHPRLLVARLSSLPQLKELFIGFSIPIPRPSTERELLGGQRAPIILPSLTGLRFKGVGAYLESLVAQFRAPLLEQLHITLFNQVAFALPHLSYLLNITEEFKLTGARVGFDHNMVVVSTVSYIDTGLTITPAFESPFFLCVICKPLDWQIDCMAQICHGLIPALSCVEKLTLYYNNHEDISNELRNGGIDSATWNNLLRPFIAVKDLVIQSPLSEELSLALQLDEVGLDPGFLPNLKSITAKDDLFTSFIDTRQVVGHPVQLQVV